jgi:hypothetical protein
MGPTAGLTFLRKTFFCKELIQYFLVVRAVVSSIHWVRYTCRKLGAFTLFPRELEGKCSIYRACTWFVSLQEMVQASGVLFYGFF